MGSDVVSSTCSEGDLADRVFHFSHGVVFDDGVHNAGVDSVTVHHSKYIEVIEIHYRDGYSQRHGVSLGKWPHRVDSWSVPDGQEISCIRYKVGARDSALHALQFVTNTGEQSPMFGGSGGFLKFDRGSKLIGITGQHGQVIGHVKFIWDHGKSLQNWGDYLTHSDDFDDGIHREGLEGITVHHSKYVLLLYTARCQPSQCGAVARWRPVKMKLEQALASQESAHVKFQVACFRLMEQPSRQRPRLFPLRFPRTLAHQLAIVGHKRDDLAGAGLNRNCLHPRTSKRSCQQSVDRRWTKLLSLA
eukprot:TRINITY_DN14703_c0_g1_i2.p1 TRINITY_DN14703_c0_g1~~TRINITY_DN14703_c0_g1_i2.p1  ORF type:complete len:303 (-),score=27.55 TRINITY_DN14703_c0_g1_i2:88-996(-)